MGESEEKGVLCSAMTLEPGTGADYTWHILVNALFALAESTQTADAAQLALLVRNTHLFVTCCAKMILLPRQTRDKHRENSKREAFLSGARGQPSNERDS